MKNKLVMGAMMLLLVGGMAFGRNYNLDDQAAIDLSNVNEVTFDLRGVSCSLCIRSIDILSEISGDGSGSDMQLSLDGWITSNREKAVPLLNVDESARRVTVSLYPDRKSFFGLNQGGTALFTAILPTDFKGKISISGASDDMIVRNFSLEELDVRTSSGDLEASSIEAVNVSLKISSGDLQGNNLVSRENLVIESSSGKLTLGSLQGSDVSIEASSGDIAIEETVSSGRLYVKASSGRITASSLIAEDAELESSSGRIDIDTLTAESVLVDVSSGDVRFDLLQAGDVRIGLSSGDLTIDEIIASETDIKTSGDTTIKLLTGAVKLKGSSGTVDMGFATFEDAVSIDVSSGDITLEIPEGSGFDAALETSSGRIRSDFAVMGDLSADGDEMKGSVNGGGATLQAETSSGNVTLLAR